MEVSARWRRTGTIVLVVQLATAVVLSSCGGERQSDRQAIRSTVTSLQGALAEGDLAAACSELTEDAQRHVGDAGHDPPTTCERDLLLIYRSLEKGEGLREPARRKIASIAIDGDRAQVTVTANGGPAFAVPVAHEDGDWKVDALYGDIPGGSQDDNFINPGEGEPRATRPTIPPPPGQPRPVSTEPTTGVTVRGTQRGGSRRCGRLTPDGKGGGCGGVFIRSNGQIEFTVRTLAGDLPFARCLYNYYLRIDGDGRTTMDGILSGGENPCNDVRPCLNRRKTDWPPWRGRIRRLPDGGYVHRIAACVDTCLGQFEGTLTMPLARHGRVWRATIDSTQVGDSGYLYGDGEWDWRIPGLAIAPTSN